MKTATDAGSSLSVNLNFGLLSYECSCNYFYDYESEAGTDIDVYGFVCETGGFTDDRGATLETFSSPARLEIIECPFTTPAPTAATTTRMIPICILLQPIHYVIEVYHVYSTRM